jgi:hypothetical protein
MVDLLVLLPLIWWPLLDGYWSEYGLVHIRECIIGFVHLENPLVLPLLEVHVKLPTTIYALDCTIVGGWMPIPRSMETTLCLVSFEASGLHAELHAWLHAFPYQWTRRIEFFAKRGISRSRWEDSIAYPQIQQDPYSRSYGNLDQTY